VLECPLNGGDALRAKRGEHVFLGRKVIEESSLTNIGGIGNVLYGRLEIAPLSKDFQRSAEKALARFGAMAFAAALAGVFTMPNDCCG
jgi:hypothetical protein